MSDGSQIGLFGKLPAHGDFVYRNLPANFINVWDEWLQQFIGGSKEQIGEDWLNIYLTSPIWRFVFSEGTVDENAWGGIIMPSVDKVGRYFPFSVLVKINSQMNPLEFITSQDSWFDSVEDLTLQALDGQFLIDELMQEISNIELSITPAYNKSQRAVGNAVVMGMDFEEQSPASTYPYFLDSLLLNTVASYSAWTTKGSDRVAPCFFMAQGLPPVNGAPAMLDGQWSHWNWQQPYSLRPMQ